MPRSGRRSSTRRSSAIGSPKCSQRPPLQVPIAVCPGSRTNSTVAGRNCPAGPGRTSLFLPIKLGAEAADETGAMSADETAVNDQPVVPQPTPAADGKAPCGSFYTETANGSGPPLATAPKTSKKPKKSKNARRQAKADRRQASERREAAERREGSVEP